MTTIAEVRAALEALARPTANFSWEKRGTMFIDTIDSPPMVPLSDVLEALPADGVIVTEASLAEALSRASLDLGCNTYEEDAAMVFAAILAALRSPAPVHGPVSRDERERATPEPG